MISSHAVFAKNTYRFGGVTGNCGWLMHSPHPQFAKLRENAEYVNMLQKYVG